MSFSFYCVDSDYCNFLREKDKCVPYNTDKKSTRPFVGIVLSINGYNYYAPLSSPKPKHLKMKNQIDFLKIENGEWGVINFNNMIPIHSNCINKVNMRILPTDSKDDIDYKNLLANQLSWCNSHKDMIITKAHKLYASICGGKAREELVNRCCDFPVDEQQYNEYCKKHGIF